MIYIKSELVLFQMGANNIFCWSGAYDNCVRPDIIVNKFFKHNSFFFMISGFRILWPMMHQPVILFLSLLFVVPCMNQSLVPCWSCTGQYKTCATEDPNGGNKVCTNFVTTSWWILKLLSLDHFQKSEWGKPPVDLY